MFEPLKVYCYLRYQCSSHGRFTVIGDIIAQASEVLLLLEILVFEPLKVYCYLRYQCSSHGRFTVI